jgi:hypothetical protein
MELTALPNELLAHVFKHLASVDDVHHLGRSCKAAYAIIKDQSTYVKIMRSVIGCSQAHRFDIQLCQMLEVHNYAVSHFRTPGLPFIPTLLSRGGLHHTNASRLECYIAEAVQNDEDEAGTDGLFGLTDARIYEVPTISASTYRINMS